MSQHIVTPGNYQPAQQRIDPNRLAWGVLLLAFAVFCVICVIVIIGVDFFLFQSTMPMAATLNVGRGSVAVTDLANPIEQVGRNGASLTKGMIISTDPQSQGTIRFKVDGADGDQLVAAITLHKSAALTILESARPRFEWSRSGLDITLDNVIGELSIDVPAPAGEALRISARTPGGALVNFVGSGRYIIEAASEQLRVFNRQGKVNIISPDLQAGRDIPVDGLGVVHYADNRVELKPGYGNLLVDMNFESVGNDVPADASEPAWVCSNDPGDEPAGSAELVTMDGVHSLRLLRSDEATTHGRTSCVQSFGQSGIEIQPDAFNYLALRMTFKVDYQSLGACGIEGSECPLMLRMDYIDADGEAQKWFHGFYARGEDAFPSRCSTCFQDHDRINDRAWYTYESPNLLTFFNPDDNDTLTTDRTPQTIVALWLYASGHQYDVRISDIALVGAQLVSEAAAEVPVAG